ncbi:MAG: ABC transporter permease [Betaproteobacteria bacterium]|nr:ABC transporter permease [Betaproteobacteria bacterium]
MRYQALPGWLRKVLILTLLAVLWEVIARNTENSPLVFPAFSLVVQTFVRLLLDGTLVSYARVSLEVLLKGMVLGSLAALLFTSVAVQFTAGRDLLELLTSMCNPLPAIAVLPIALLWLGLGEGSLLFVLVYSIVWPLSLNLYAGFTTVPQTLLRVGQNFGLSRPRMMSDILIPATAPYILAGMRIAWAFAWRTLIAAELVLGVVGGKGGLGWFIYQQRHFLETASMFCGLATIVLIGLLVESVIFRAIEERTVSRWGMRTA